MGSRGEGPLLGALEAGGTKFVCAIGTPSGELIEEKRIATGSPEDTTSRAIDFWRASRHRLTAVGIGSFGPIELNRTSPRFGQITSTPKVGWQNFDLAGSIGRALDVPVFFDTDVNAAALGEHLWGAAQEIQSFIYVTVGTGIGGGAMVEGRLLHGLLHPEMGHLRIPHDLQADPFPGICPYHRDCLEGLASGPALRARWGEAAETLPLEHPAWMLEARYLAFAIANWVCTLSPQRVILGGGIMQQDALFPLIREQVAAILNGYVDAPELSIEIDRFIVPPKLGSRAGILGALALAIRRGTEA